MKTLSQKYLNILDFFYPPQCIACGNRLVSQEKYLCYECWYDLPVTNFHLNKENKVSQLFWGRVEIDNATAYFAYNKGSNYQHLIHHIKYKGLKELGFETGKKFGISLMESPAYQLIDIVAPVPLHPKKQKQRGFNQSEWIAKGIAISLQKSLSVNNLRRRIYTSTQTKKNRYERWENVESIFEITNADEFKGKHILLVDDVVTTGSTLESCTFQILQIPETKVSIATLAFADF